MFKEPVLLSKHVLSKKQKRSSRDISNMFIVTAAYQFGKPYRYNIGILLSFVVVVVCSYTRRIRLFVELRQC